MMSLRVVILFGTCLGLAFCFAPENLGYISWVPLGLMLDLENKCPRNATNGTDVFELLPKTWHCITNHFKTEESFCETYETVIQNCFQPAVDHFHNCVPEGLKDFPQALVDTIVSVTGAVCTSTGELLLEVLNDCLFPDANNEVPREYCDQKEIDKNLNKINNLNSKLEICQGVTEIGSCWKQLVNQNCPSPKTKEFAEKFLEALLTTCRT